MNIKNRFSIAAALVLTFASFTFAQTNTLTQTTASVAVLASDNFITVTSATGISAPGSGVIGSELYIIAPGYPRGEVALVQSVSGTRINLARGRGGIRSAFPVGSLVLIGQPNWFSSFTPSGGCTASTTFVTPVVNTKTGEQAICSTITNSYVAGWNDSAAGSGVTAAVASAAGSIVPSGPLFHVTGTAAVTGFTNASMIGFAGSGSFTIIPDGAFTWTTAGNIALAGTGVVNKQLIFTWDGTNSKWIPSY